MKLEIKARLRWIKLYQKTGDAGLVCRRCGISRPTLRKWLRRYEEAGLDGLHDKSKKPHRSPNRKVSKEHETIILNLREKRKLGAHEYKASLYEITNFGSPWQPFTKSSIDATLNL